MSLNIFERINVRFFFQKKKKCRENRLHAIPQIPEVARPLNSDSLTSPTRMVRKSSFNIIQILWVFIESGITILTKQCSQNCTTTNLKNRFSCIGKYRNYVRFILYLHRWFRRQKPSSGRMTIENWIFKKQKKKKANIRRIVDILEVYHFFFSFLFLYIENSAFRENHNYICKRSDCVWKKKIDYRIIRVNYCYPLCYIIKQVCTSAAAASPKNARRFDVLLIIKK